MLRISLNKPIDLQGIMVMVDKDIVNHAQNHDVRDSILCIDIRQITDTITSCNKHIELKEREVKDA